MIRIKHLLFGLLAVVLVLTSVVWLTRDFWYEQLRAYARGTIELATDKYGSELPPVDKVEFSILGIGSASAADGFPGRVGNLVYYRVTSQSSITDKEAKEFTKAWRAMPFSWKYGALCHEPVYGLRFFNKEKLIFETTLCWKCSNFYVPTQFGYSYCGFRAKSPQAEVIWDLLQKHAPLPQASRKKE